MGNDTRHRRVAAGVIVRGYGFGLVGNIVAGILGAIFGGWLFEALGLDSRSVVGTILGATVGAVLILLIIRLVRRAS